MKKTIFIIILIILLPFALVFIHDVRKEGWDRTVETWGEDIYHFFTK